MIIKSSTWKFKMENIKIFTIPSCQPIVANVLKSEDDFYVIEYPVILIKEDIHLYAIPYNTFAKDGIVCLVKNNIISIANVQEEIQEFYKEMMVDLKDNKIIFKKPSQSENKKEQLMKQKLLH